MARMRLFNLLLVFFLCFSSFLLGWTTAVYILPGGLMAKDTSSGDIQADLEKRQKDSVSKLLKPDNKSKADKDIPFFEEMKKNILILFDPYQMDSALIEGTLLKNQNSYIKKSATGVTTKDFENNKKVKDKSYDKLARSAAPVALPHDDSLQAGVPFIGEKNKEIQLQLKEAKAKYDKRNREQLTAILDSQNIFKMEGKFSFLVNVFSDEEEALSYVKKMKMDYPLWSFLIKVHSDHIRIYLGPIVSRSKALEFKKTIPQPEPFSLDFLEEISL